MLISVKKHREWGVGSGEWGVGSGVRGGMGVFLPSITGGARLVECSEQPHNWS
ncbi:MAG: hypothetical protein DSM106950_35085 [Stigonema ocellatum SAG 48.90 = DSM 106950]|nr:hypothetical protein [Stigonema ocellatum SAG 48.90 = DSM 106950]